MTDQESEVRICTGFKDLKLTTGERIDIISGIETEVPPEYVEVIREYPHLVMLELTFIKSYYPVIDPSPRSYRVCVHKGAMLCGDVILQRVNDRSVLVGENIGYYGPEEKDV